MALAQTNKEREVPRNTDGEIDMELYVYGRQGRDARLMHERQREDRRKEWAEFMGKEERRDNMQRKRSLRKVTATNERTTPCVS